MTRTRCARRGRRTRHRAGRCATATRCPTWPRTRTRTYGQTTDLSIHQADRSAPPEIDDELNAEFVRLIAQLQHPVAARAAFNPRLHPHAPAHTPGGIGGQFVHNPLHGVLDALRSARSKQERQRLVDDLRGVQLGRALGEAGLAKSGTVAVKRQRLADWAEHGGVPAPAKATPAKAAKAAPRTVADIAAAVDAATSREEADAHLEGLSLPQLKAVAAEMKITLRGKTKADIRNDISGTVTFKAIFDQSGKSAFSQSMGLGPPTPDLQQAARDRQAAEGRHVVDLPPVQVTIDASSGSDTGRWRATDVAGLSGASRRAMLSAATGRVRDSGNAANEQLRFPNGGGPSEGFIAMLRDSYPAGSTLLSQEETRLAKERARGARDIHALDAAMQQSPLPSAVVLWRGIRPSDIGLPAGDAAGFEWTDAGFVGTSATRDVPANSFAQGALLRITAPAGTPAIGIQGGGEHEVLLNRGQRFRVVADRVESGGHRVLDIEVVPSGAQRQQAAVVDRAPTPAVAPRKAAGGGIPTSPTDEDLRAAIQSKTVRELRKAATELGIQMPTDSVLPDAFKNADYAAQLSNRRVVARKLTADELRQHILDFYLNPTPSDDRKRRDAGLSVAEQRRMLLQVLATTSTPTSAKAAKAAPRKAAVPKAPRVAKAAAGQPEPSDALKRLEAIAPPPPGIPTGTREDAAAIVAPLNRTALVAIARELSIPNIGKLKVADLRHEIVEAAVGRRLDSIATRGFTGLRP